jgi:hypothetical protein
MAAVVEKAVSEVPRPGGKGAEESSESEFLAIEQKYIEALNAEFKEVFDATFFTENPFDARDAVFAKASSKLHSIFSANGIPDRVAMEIYQLVFRTYIPAVGMANREQTRKYLVEALDDEKVGGLKSNELWPRLWWKLLHPETKHVEEMEREAILRMRGPDGKDAPSIRSMARVFRRSTETIERVLNEAGYKTTSESE